MYDSALTRLRVGFTVLGVMLLVPLLLLLRSVESRLEAQRRLRHEIVAERIFDEMERELTSLLAREAERPSAAYDATETRIETWAPFVVGYFTREQTGLRVIAREQLTGERAARVERAVQLALPPAAVTPPKLDQVREQDRADGESAAPARQQAREEKAKRALPQKALPEAVLRQLNRGADQRDYEQKKTRSAAPLSKNKSGKLDDTVDDPLMGLQ